MNALPEDNTTVKVRFVRAVADSGPRSADFDLVLQKHGKPDPRQTDAVRILLESIFCIKFFSGK
jgi:hypothetical protein